MSYTTLMNPDLTGSAGTTMYLHPWNEPDTQLGGQIIDTADSDAHRLSRDSTIIHQNCSAGCYLEIKGDEYFAVAVSQ